MAPYPKRFGRRTHPLDAAPCTAGAVQVNRLLSLLPRELIPALLLVSVPAVVAVFALGEGLSRVWEPFS